MYNHYTFDVKAYLPLWVFEVLEMPETNQARCPGSDGFISPPKKEGSSFLPLPPPQWCVVGRVQCSLG